MKTKNFKYADENDEQDRRNAQACHDCAQDGEVRRWAGLEKQSCA